MARGRLDFYYEFASTYSYLAAARIGPLAEAAGVEVTYVPFLLGPIFAAQGYSTSPFNLYPEKGRHMWRDLERLAAHYGLPPIVRPATFPANGLLAARVATALNDASRPGFTKALFLREFAEGQDISDPAVIRQVLAGLGHFCDAPIEAAQSQANKDRLRAQTERAQAAGVFGAPSFVTPDGELFWGNDRLELALDHAVRGA
ncbi:2-hydroxychromene-2-carboxylate isomerase [Aquabacter spiritensis]|uniref:2-hydroxychromene-2-carboxylate isomerase n=1 Tax=Aquabacter spiritensis TaxID=933073 RepID=A0A4R3LUW0_9HYPH|nr:2-hydroxychromene-2-carboxylate isomerase [Aquabacter spiritensis]TCT04333.1 2-hydroxychromene-2-carboxylate isomerase [Aquabacter spiritensis]